MTNNHPEELLPTTEATPEPAAEPEIAPETVQEIAPAAEPVLAAVDAPLDTVEALPEATLPAAPATTIPKPSAPVPIAEPIEDEPAESFADLLNAFERSHSHKGETGQRQLQGVVVSLSADQVFLDIGYKTEGVLPRSAFENNAEAVKPGDIFPVSVTGRNEEHYYELSRFKVAQVRDWSALAIA